MIRSLRTPSESDGYKEVDKHTKRKCWKSLKQVDSQYIKLIVWASHSSFIHTHLHYKIYVEMVYSQSLLAGRSGTLRSRTKQ